MGFDVQNFGLGLLAGWASAYGIYRVRRQIVGAVEATRGRAAEAQRSATRSADSRYAADLIEHCETAHLAGKVARLTDILVEPRFLPAPQLAAPPSDDVIHSVFHIVPQIHDLPWLHSVYNLETLSIDDLVTGDKALALLGLPGSGRTTALHTIALRCMRRVHFEHAEDRVQQQINAEEAALNEKERAARIKERMMIEERARDRLREQHGITFEAEPESQNNSRALRLNQYMPVYIHLANIPTSPDELRGPTDPAEPLVRAVQHQVGRITSSTIPANLYRRLGIGQVMLLVDGYDDLPPHERPGKLAWLHAFLEEYGDNFVIVTGPASGYAPLTDLGLAPIFMRPWSNLDITTAVNRWAEAWPRITGTRRKPGPSADPGALEAAHQGNRARTPAEITLRTWATLAGSGETESAESWLKTFIGRATSATAALDEVLPVLSQAAALQLEEGYITLTDLVESTYVPGGETPVVTATSTIRPLQSTDDDDDLLDEMLDNTPSTKAAVSHRRDAKSASAEARKAEAEEQKRREAFVRTQKSLLNQLTHAGILVRFRGERYQFCHAIVTNYLASLTLHSLAPEALAEKAHNPAWDGAFALAALHTPLDAAVRARLSAPTDMLHSGAFDVSRWLAFAKADVPWRGPVLKHLGNMLIAPSQFPLLRERATAALLGTRDPNVLYVFRQAVRNVNPDVRRLACLGIGALGSNEGINDLAPLLGDQIADVQLAAGLGLGAIGSEEALETMVVTFTEGSEQLRQAVAEAMAAIPDEGHPILYDAIVHDDMMVRRAATFGLKRIQANWAIIALYRAFLEDEQWYVRSAAQQAFQEIQQGEKKGPRAYPPVQWIPWLAEWATTQGHEIGTDEDAWQILVKALHEGEPPVRVLAAATIGQMGHTWLAPQLYEALCDRDEQVRTAAHFSLGNLQSQYGLALPAPA